MKAFENVNWNVMMNILKMTKIDYRDRRIIRELYKHQRTPIKIKESKREAAIRKGVRKGCNLPSLLFNPYPTAFPYGNDMVLHFYQQQESSTTKTVHKIINKGLKTYV